MKILILEKNKELNSEIHAFCSNNSHELNSVYDGTSAIDKIDNNDFDLFIVDIHPLDMCGLDIVKYIRKKDINTPIIVISDSLELKDLQNAYKNGCNEYLKKPFFLEELEIRVKSIVSKNKISYIHFSNDFHYDFNKNNFYYKEEAINLRYKERRLCNLLIKNIGKVVKNDLIHNNVWENEIKDFYPLRQLVSELRKKLPHNIIVTKPKEGYLIEEVLSTS